MVASGKKLIICIFFLLSQQVQAQKKAVQKKDSPLPNIIIIYADDLGYGDLGSYGAEFKTPHIDEIGRQGIRFSNFYVASPVCTPSRFGLLTGQYPEKSKRFLTTALMPGATNYLDTSEHTIGWYLQKKKYHTGIIGKWHLGIRDSATRPTQYGFDHFTGMMGGAIDYFNHDYGSMGSDWYVNNQPAVEKGYSTDLLTSHAIRFIESTRQGQPFFLYLAYNAPHYGKTDTTRIQPLTISLGTSNYKGVENINSLQVPEEYMKRVETIKDPYRKAYAAMVTALDDNVGRLLEWLKKKNLLDNTIIWFMSDNGGYARSYYAHGSNGKLKGEKAELWEGGIKVPAMLMWKNRIRQQQTMNDLFCNIDVLPTLASITGMQSDLPASLDGLDRSKILLEGQHQERSLYWKFNKDIAFRQGDWKLFNGKELYDLNKDPEEKNNLAGQYPAIVLQLKELQQKKVKEIKAFREMIVLPDLISSDSTQSKSTKSKSTKLNLP